MMLFGDWEIHSMFSDPGTFIEHFLTVNNSVTFKKDQIKFNDSLEETVPVSMSIKTGLNGLNLNVKSSESRF